MGDPSKATNLSWSTVRLGSGVRPALSRRAGVAGAVLLALVVSFVGMTRASAAAETPGQTFSRLGLNQWWNDPLFRTYGDIHEATGFCVGNLGQECGVDYAMVVGTPIGALAAGRVVNIQDRRPTSLGFIIQVLTPGNHLWHYEHMFTSSVVAGQAVTVGQRLGMSGGLTQSFQTDYFSSGPHIEVRYAVSYNPSPSQFGAVWGQNFIEPRPMIAATVATALATGGAPTLTPVPTPVPTPVATVPTPDPGLPTADPGMTAPVPNMPAPVPGGGGGAPLPLVTTTPLPAVPTQMPAGGGGGGGAPMPTFHIWSSATVGARVHSAPLIQAPVLLSPANSTPVSITCWTTGPMETDLSGNPTTVWDRVTIGGVTGFITDARIFTGTMNATGPHC